MARDFSYKSKDEIFHMFEHSPLVEIKINLNVHREDPSPLTMYKFLSSPFPTTTTTKFGRTSTPPVRKDMVSSDTIETALMEYEQSDKRDILKKGFESDDEQIKLLEEEQGIKDFLYKYFENKDVGVFMEKWICANIRCTCSGKFAKYSNPNMPVVDIKCINPGHDINIHGPKYYQVKSTEIGTKMFDFEYFQLNPYQLLFVGSPSYGKYSHEIKGGDIDKRTLIGYICIKYKKINDSTININKDVSFILIPNMQVTPELQMELYYTYIEGMRKPMIRFNTKLFTIQFMKTIDIDMSQINIYTRYDEKPI